MGSLIKVCGMREPDNIRAVESLGIDMMGFIFWPRSLRYVSERPACLPTHCKRVGVFVDATIEDITQHITDYALDFIQFHGSESLEFIRNLRSACGSDTATPRLIKAFNIASVSDLPQTESYEGLVDLFLFDTKGKSVGGNGQQFDWGVLSAYKGDTPFLLSGGIGPDDAERVLAFNHPKCLGFDLNSRFEIAPGLKDSNKLNEFLKKIKQ